MVLHQPPAGAPLYHHSLSKDAKKLSVHEELGIRWYHKVFGGGVPCEGRTVTPAQRRARRARAPGAPGQGAQGCMHGGQKGVGVGRGRGAGAWGGGLRRWSREGI